MSTPTTTRRFINWAFTANNPSEGTRQRLTTAVKDVGFINAIIFQKERGEPTSEIVGRSGSQDVWSEPVLGTVHLQGTLQCLSKKSWSQLNRSLGLESAGIHWENVKELLASIEYCRLKEGELSLAGNPKKGFVYEGSQVTDGTFRTRGARTDLDALGAEIATGSFDLEALKVNNFGVYARNYRAIDRRVAEVAMKKRNDGDFDPPIFLVFWGPTGTGKSYRVREECRLAGLNCYTVVAGTSSCFFDGYDPDFHQALHFEDFYGWYEYARMLVLVDKYPTILQIKGTVVAIDPPKRVYITSNVQPSDWWPRTARAELERDKTVLAALARRLSTYGSGIYKLTEKFETQVGGVILDPPTGVEKDPGQISPNFNF